MATADEINLHTALLRKDQYIYKKMRQRAIIFINSNKNSTKDSKKGFSNDLKSGRSLPKVEYLIQFKDHLVRIVKE